MSVFNFKGYLAPSARGSLGGELIGFNAKTGQPVQAAAGSLGSYQDVTPDFYKTFQHDNWQHPGSSGWSTANMPGWGNNPNLQMFPRRAFYGLGRNYVLDAVGKPLLIAAGVLFLVTRKW